jgi:tRNA(Ile2)-agmatinylcytidine synthase
MTIIGIDDTDSRTHGMCTTYVGHLISEELQSLGEDVSDVFLIRLNPAAKHKTRGNASVAIHTSADPSTALDVAESIVFPNAADQDPETNPGVVVCPDSPSEDVANFTLEVIHTLCEIEDAKALIESNGYEYSFRGNGRGLIGSLAAIGAEEAIDDWTYEFISYREENVRGSERQFNHDALFDAADEFYPKAWDTVDRVQGDAVCVPHTPGPILFGIRGDDTEAVEGLTFDVEGTTEPVESRQMFRTNQGTDVHLQEGAVSSVENDKAYQLNGTVNEKPRTVEGGHVFFTLEEEGSTLDVVAFEPTKHFREKVRSLRVGDQITVCGEVSDDTLKLEKFAIRGLNTTERVNPTCPDCGNSMSSAGANAGYRCKNCSNHTDEKDEVDVERELETGWYEVPPCARRHIAKPLIRGGFDDVTHPFK